MEQKKNQDPGNTEEADILTISEREFTERIRLLSMEEILVLEFAEPKED